jgi:hypothetical protein
MTDNEATFRPISDPAADGLPETADDDSYADDALEMSRDPNVVPAPLPPDREDGPMGLDEYGTTPEELHRGEPLDRRLARERPDRWRQAEEPDPAMAVDLDPDEVGQLTQDTEELTEDEPVDPRLGSSVSMYDRPVRGIPSVRPLGRLIRPGGGYGSSEADEVAQDVGPTAGGFGSEELAMHEMPGEQVDLEESENSDGPYVVERPKVWHVVLG